MRRLRDAHFDCCSDVGALFALQQVLFAPKSQLKGFSFVGVEDVVEAAPAGTEGQDEDEEIDIPEEDV